MKIVWFKKRGWAHLPVQPAGVAVTLFAVLFPVPVYAAVTRAGRSVRNDLYEPFVYTACTPLWWKRTADKTGRHAR